MLINDAMMMNDADEIMKKLSWDVFGASDRARPTWWFFEIRVSPGQSLKRRHMEAKIAKKAVFGGTEGPPLLFFEKRRFGPENAVLGPFWAVLSHFE